MSNKFSENVPKIEERLLDMALDDFDNNQDLLEQDVKPFLRKSNSRPNRFLVNQTKNEECDHDDNEDTWSHRKPQSEVRHLPEIVLSGRSRHHFEGMVGKVFAYNLLFEVTDDDLQTLFGAFGQLKRAAINYNRNGQSMGTGFVVFMNRVDAQNAFKALDGRRMDGRKLLLRLLDSAGMRGVDINICNKRIGDRMPINNDSMFEDKENLSKNDLDNMDLNTYVQRRKRAKTWNYY